MKLKINILLSVLVLFVCAGCYGTKSAEIELPTPANNGGRVAANDSSAPATENTSPTPPANKTVESKNSDLKSLKSWIGKYPIDDSKQKNNFFSLPEVKTPLLKILGKKGYADFLDGFELVEPIEFLKKPETIGGKQSDFEYLIVQGAYTGRSKRNENAAENTLFVIELNNKEFYILTVKNGQLRERGNVDEFVLPEEIEKKITAYVSETK